MVKLMRSIKRVYHPYWMWEELQKNMWGSVDDYDSFLNWAIEFTGNSDLYGSYMMMVAKEWKYSCEHNLSNLQQNRKAWIGHAACAMANECPEDIVRKAWGFLDKQQQDEANAEAEKAILWWEENMAEYCDE